MLISCVTVCYKMFKFKKKIKINTSCDLHLDLDPTTLTYELDPENVKVYQRTKMNFLGQGLQKSEVGALQTDRQTDRQLRPNTLPRRICTLRALNFTELAESRKHSI